MLPTVHIGIPAMDENDYLFDTLKCIERQNYAGKIQTYICVNQPEWWHDDDNKRDICKRNAELLEKLRERKKGLIVIDKTTKGNGWATKKKSGVGVARQTLLNEILERATEKDIFVSMDADCTFGNNYINSVVCNLEKNKQFSAFNSPYYHRLTSNENADRGILRYEIYMRIFLLNMLRIKSPFAFTAFGSAIACRIKTCKSLGNFDAHQAGEDFYFLQKIVKHEKISLYGDEIITPSSRMSDRVPFGTGKAIATMEKEERTYPIFHHSFFDKIAEAYQILDSLYKKDIHSELFDFLQSTSKEKESIWTSIRENSSSLQQFKRMFHQKCDGLKIFQFLRQQAEQNPFCDEVSLIDFFSTFFPDFSIDKNFSFKNSSTEILSEIRDFLFAEEQKARAEHDKILSQF